MADDLLRFAEGAVRVGSAEIGAKGVDMLGIGGSGGTSG